MNTEHTFPKSHGVKVLAALSDLHHLFPTDDETNGRRASHPFGNVTGKVKFSKDESRLGNDALASWSSSRRRKSKAPSLVL
ncbi:MAG: hypothetical protein GY822_19225 [Deltaproteobacteria bacterium]|nr:hypothetical protein [Deltaproteobacteria bacterium]